MDHTAAASIRCDERNNSHLFTSSRLPRLSAVPVHPCRPGESPVAAIAKTRTSARYCRHRCVAGLRADCGRLFVEFGRKAAPDDRPGGACGVAAGQRGACRSRATAARPSPGRALRRGHLVAGGVQPRRRRAVAGDGDGVRRRRWPAESDRTVGARDRAGRRRPGNGLPGHARRVLPGGCGRGPGHSGGRGRRGRHRPG